jgi:hypothetical protein
VIEFETLCEGAIQRTIFNVRCHLKRKTEFPKLLNLKKPKRWGNIQNTGKIDQYLQESDAMYLEKTTVNTVVGIVMRLRAGRSEVRIPELSHLQNGQMGCGAQPTYLQWLAFFHEGKAAGA